MDKAKIKKDFLILFPDGHLAYSPSTLNLFNQLKKYHQVELVSAGLRTPSSKNQMIDVDVKYVHAELKRSLFNLIKDVFYKIADVIVKPSEKVERQRKLYNYRTRPIIAFLRRTNKEIIAVDPMILWCAQQAGKSSHLLSLELYQNDVYLENTRLESIKSVIIQSIERLNYLFPREKPKYFIVQNSPLSKYFTPEYSKRKKTDLVYCGSAGLDFGIVSCLDFIKDYKEYTLTVRGGVPEETKEVINKFYSDLIEEKRLIINRNYLPADELVDYISNFRIGFAFYDFYRFSHLRTFNYFTAPSGKVFQYLNSGVPIIANDLPGFHFIDEKGCGKLITHLSSTQIKLAIEAIESDYLSYAENAKKISYEYDFNKMIWPFIEFTN